MIIDQIHNAQLYFAVHPRLQPAFAYLQQVDCASLAVGRYEIDGANLYALVQEYETKPQEAGLWEAHRRYLDLQYLFRGAEKIGYANLKHLTPGEYQASQDFLPLSGPGDFFTLQSGDFVILLPEDAHMPGLAVNTPAPVKKIVLKLLLAE